MDISVPFSENDKNEMYNLLVDTLLAGLEAGTAAHEEAQESSGFILENLEKVTNHNELILFLEEVSSRWPVYHDVLLKVRAQQHERQDNQQIQQAREQIQTITN